MPRAARARLAIASALAGLLMTAGAFWGVTQGVAAVHGLTFAALDGAGLCAPTKEGPAEGEPNGAGHLPACCLQTCTAPTGNGPPPAPRPVPAVLRTISAVAYAEPAGQALDALRLRRPQSARAPPLNA